MKIKLNFVSCKGLKLLVCAFNGDLVRELAERKRKALGELFFTNTWGKPVIGEDAKSAT